MSLLDFSVDSMPVEPQTKTVRTAKPELFEAGATYELDGAVYRAQLFGDTWLLANLNKTYRCGGVYVFCGYVVEDGVLYQCEYAGRGGRRWWQAGPVQTAVQASDFKRCGVIRAIINLNE